MERPKRFREPNKVDFESSTASSLAVDGNDVQQQVTNSPLGAPTKRIKITTDGHEWEFEIPFKPHADVKVSFAEHPMEAAIRFRPKGEMKISIISHSPLKPYLKSKPLDSKADERLVLRARPNRYRPTTFPFLRLPAELRLEIYRLVVLSDEKGWLPRHRQRQIQSQHPGSSYRAPWFRSPRAMGVAQKLLWLNRKIRNEVAVEVFKAPIFEFYPSENHDLTTVRDLLLQIGQAGRDHIKRLQGIRWWISSWKDTSMRETDGDQILACVVELLRSCKNLGRLEIFVPNNKGFAASKLKPSRFRSVCGFGLLRSINHVTKVEIYSSYPELKKWLEDGMQRIEL